jgi:hypothetical protein
MPLRYRSGPGCGATQSRNCDALPQRRKTARPIGADEQKRQLFGHSWRDLQPIKSSQTRGVAAKRLLRGLWAKISTHHRLAFPDGQLRPLREQGVVLRNSELYVTIEMRRRSKGGHEQR